MPSAHRAMVLGKEYLPLPPVTPGIDGSSQKGGCSTIPGQIRDANETSHGLHSIGPCRAAVFTLLQKVFDLLLLN